MEKKFPLRFFIVTFLWTWLILITCSLLIRTKLIPESLSLPFIIFSAFGPAAGTFFSLRTIEGKGSIKKYLQKFKSFKFGWIVWISIFLVLGLASFIAWIVPELFGLNRLSQYMPIYFFLPYLVICILFGGGQEEIGWRGYILPYLEKKYGLIIGSLILGIIWAIWHLPLWFIPGSTQSYMNFFSFILLTIGYSYFFSWIIEKSGNRLLSGPIVHGTGNGIIVLFPTLIMEKNTIQIRFWIYCIIIFIAGIIIVTTRTIKTKQSRKNGP